MKRGRRPVSRIDKALRGPRKGEPWIWFATEMLHSKAWRALGINARRFVEFLVIEHSNHAGQENGALHATYDQLVLFGIPRSEIRGAIEEAEALGFVRTVTHGGRWGGTNTPSIYRLTFYSYLREGSLPTNDWKRIDEKRITAWRAEKRERIAGRLRRHKKQIGSSESRTPVVREIELREPIVPIGSSMEAAETSLLPMNGTNSGSRTASNISRWEMPRLDRDRPAQREGNMTSDPPISSLATSAPSLTTPTPSTSDPKSP